MKYRLVKFPMTKEGVDQQTQRERPSPDDDGDLTQPQHSVSDFDRSKKVPDRLAEQPQAENESPTLQPPDEGLRRSTRTRRPHPT